MYDLIIKAAFRLYKNKRFSKPAIAVCATILVGKLSYDRYRKRQTMQKIRDKQAKLLDNKQGLKQRLVQSDGQLLTEERVSIVNKTAPELVALMTQGTLDPVDVLQAFQAKALIVDEKINAVCEYITEAVQWASELRKIPLDQRGPLYGLPVSVKECFFIEGYDSTIGLAGLIGQPLPKDSRFVNYIKKAHGIPFCITNVPQTMFSFRCSNPIFGESCNPHDLTRTPGGSSGGEAALLAAGGSPFGLGSDIGGSIRIPATFCGIYGLKPSTGRLYHEGRRNNDGTGLKALRPCINSTAGFMTPNMESLTFGMKIILGSLERVREMGQEDWRVIPLPWQEDLFEPTRKLRVGWYDDDGFFPAMPGCKRAVHEVVERLKEAGHSVTEWKGIDHTEFFRTFSEIILSDLGYHSLKQWKGEILDKCIEVNALNYKCPEKMRWLLSAITRLFSKKTKMLVEAHPTLSRDLWVTNAKRDSLIDAMMAEWNRHDFDIVICPGFPFPAPPHKYPTRILPASSYTGVYNVTGQPVGCLPVTRETQSDQDNMAHYPVSADLTHQLAFNATKGAVGCPLGIQVVGRHYQEEMVLQAMEIIANLVDYDHTVPS